MAKMRKNVTAIFVVSEVEKLHSLLLNFQQQLEIISTWIYSKFDDVPIKIKTALLPIPIPDWEQLLEDDTLSEPEIKEESTDDTLSIDVFTNNEFATEYIENNNIEQQENCDTSGIRCKQKKTNYQMIHEHKDFEESYDLKEENESCDGVENDSELYQTLDDLTSCSVDSEHYFFISEEHSYLENKNIQAGLSKSIQNTTPEVKLHRLSNTATSKIKNYAKNTSSDVNPQNKKSDPLQYGSGSSKNTNDANSHTVRKTSSRIKNRLSTRAKNKAKIDGNTRTYKCEKCNKVYASTNSFRRHITERVCAKAQKRFTQNQNKNSSSNNDSFPSDKEINDITEDLESTSTKAIVIPLSDSPLECSKCGKNFQRINSFNDHLLAGCFVCNICKTSFKDESTLRTHLEKHENPLICTFDDCSEKFLSLRKLTLHKKVHGVIEYFCKLCEKVFPKSSSYKNHLMSQHPEKYSKRKTNGKIKFSCEKCEKRFSSEKNLKTHNLTDNCLFVCKICTKLFSAKQPLDNHILRFHSSGTELPFLCNQCGKSYVSLGRLNDHIKTTHTDRSNGKTYECKYCAKKFINRQGLYIHTQRHEDAGKKQCSFCGIYLVNSSSLVTHIKRVHEKVRAYKCELCDTSFKSNANLKYHVNTHNNPHTRKRSLNKEKD